MRILQLAPRFSEHAGGDGLYVYHLTNGLLELGHEISVLTIQKNEFIIKQFKPIYSGDKWEVIDHTVGKKGDGFWEENFYSTIASQALHTALLLGKPEIIHIHSIHQNFTTSCISILKKSNIPIVFTIHDYKLLCGNSGFFSDKTYEPCTKCINGGVLFPIVERCKKNSLLYSVATAAQMSLWAINDFLDIITVVHSPSKFVSSILSKNINIKNRIVEERHPLLFNSTGNKSINSPLSILYFGRMVPHKGAQIAATAIMDIDIPVHFVGDGPELMLCKKILHNQNNVKFHGWKNQYEIRELMGKNTIVFLPYLAPETFCFAVLEALVEGCCVVTTSRGAIPELVNNFINGIIVDNPSPENFRQKLDELIRDPDLRHKLSLNARDISKSLKTISEHAESILSIYKTAILDSEKKYYLE